MSTIRFRDLIKTAGTPEPKSLWTDPKDDREFMRAIQQNRVLTVVQESARKDFGEMGFHRRQGALYFVFPKPLPAEQGRVIGIKYDLAASKEPADRLSPQKLKRAASSAPEKRAPPMKTFHVSIRRVAVMKTEVSIQALSKTEARAKSLEVVAAQEFEMAKAKIENHIQSVK